MNWEPRGAGGRNYGWRLREGRADYDARQPAAYLPLTEPIHDYPRSDGMSITGGFVYRGARARTRCSTAAISSPTSWPAASIRSAWRSTSSQEATAVDLLELTQLLGGTSELGLISSFGVDADGEMYLVSYSRGRILKIVP